MNVRISYYLALGVAALALAGCRGPNSYHANNGAAIGGVLGAAIGPQTDEALAGALIGGAVGSLTGAAIGDGMDQAEQREAYIQQRMGRAMAGAVTNEDVLAMTHAGIGDSVIIAHVQAKGLARPLEINDIITLKQSGVSDAVLAVMQRTPLAVDMAAPRPVVGPALAVIVDEPCWGPPPVYYYQRRHHHHHWDHHHRHGTSFGFSIHN